MSRDEKTKPRQCSNCGVDLREGETGHYMPTCMVGMWTCETINKFNAERESVEPSKPSAPQAPPQAAPTCKNCLEPFSAHTRSATMCCNGVSVYEPSAPTTSIKTGPVTTPVRDVGKPDKTPRIFKNDAEAVAAIIKQVREECNCYKATRLHHLPDCPAYIPEPLTSPTSTDELAHDELCRLSRVFNYHHSTMPVHAEDERIRQWLHTKIARSKR
jgi:hypothetical protein